MAVKYILSKIGSKKIRNIRFYQIRYHEKNGVPIDGKGKPIDFPSLEMLLEMAFNEIFKAGFREVRRVSPNEANCIIRVFNKTHFPYGEKEIHNLCGFNCFTQHFNTWTSISDRDEILQLDFSKCQYLNQDKSLIYDCNFFDCYICIK